MFRQLGPDGTASVLNTIVGELDSPPHPTVAIVEDAHWADDATLDVVRFLGRRLVWMRANRRTNACSEVTGLAERVR